MKDREAMGALVGTLLADAAELNDMMFVIDDPLRVFKEALKSVSALLSIWVATASDVIMLLPVTVYVTPASDKSLRLLVTKGE